MIIIPLMYIYLGFAIALLIITIPFLINTRPAKKLLIRYWGSPTKRTKAIKKATKMHQADALRYRVIFLGMRYRIICRNDIRAYKKNGTFQYHINSTNIDQFKEFDTNDLQPCLSAKKN